MVVAINRDDNPDTMLTLLLAVGAWALLESLRASRRHKLPWLTLATRTDGRSWAPDRLGLERLAGESTRRP